MVKSVPRTQGAIWQGAWLLRLKKLLVFHQGIAPLFNLLDGQCVSRGMICELQQQFARQILPIGRQRSNGLDALFQQFRHINMISRPERNAKRSGLSVRTEMTL